MNFKAFFKLFLHTAGGAAACALGSTFLPAIAPVLATHLDPLTGGLIGSALSSLVTAFCPSVTKP